MTRERTPLLHSNKWQTKEGVLRVQPRTKKPTSLSQHKHVCTSIINLSPWSATRFLASILCGQGPIKKQTMGWKLHEKSRWAFLTTHQIWDPDCWFCALTFTQNKSYTPLQRRRQVRRGYRIDDGTLALLRYLQQLCSLNVRQNYQVLVAWLVYLPL